MGGADGGEGVDARTDTRIETNYRNTLHVLSKYFELISNDNKD